MSLVGHVGSRWGNIKEHWVTVDHVEERDSNGNRTTRKERLYCTRNGQIHPRTGTFDQGLNNDFNVITHIFANLGVVMRKFKRGLRSATRFSTKRIYR
jgi:hypothetical protein